jgi:hypothetical protein
LQSLVGFFLFAKKHQGAALLLGVSVVLQLLLYAKWWHWWGGLSWGPRFLVPLAPLITLWLLPVIDRAWAGVRWAAVVLAGTLALSVAVQLLGVVDRSVGDWRDSLLLSRSGSFGLGQLDFIWIHNRQPGIATEIDYLSLSLMAGLIAMSIGIPLIVAKGSTTARNAHSALLGLLAVGSVGVIYVSLTRGYGHIAPDYKAMLSGTAANGAEATRGFSSKAPDAVIFSDFLRSAEFLNLNKSSAFVLGWGEESPLSPQLARRLDNIAQRVTAPSANVGVLVHITPNPPGNPENGIERLLNERFFVSDTAWFGKTRRVRYLVPTGNGHDSRLAGCGRGEFAGLTGLRPRL